jgi:hypothetical protein
MPSIAAVLLLAMSAAAPAMAQQTAATVNALAEAEPAARAAQHAPRLSLSAREALPGSAPRGSVDLGLQWRQPIAGQQIDVAAWRRVAPQPDALSLIQQQDTVYGARLEMKLKPAKKNFLADRFIGVQLDSGARIGIRKSNGNPTVYYRNQF